jgi:hypothetical protein
MANEIVDLQNPNEALKRIKTLNSGLGYGFDAIAMDYNFYIESTIGTGGKHPIYEWRDNVRYRFNSAELHLFLLLNHQAVISNHFGNMLQNNPKVFSGFINGNPHFERAEDEIMALYDSVIFHLSSSFDYLSMLVNFIFGANKNDKIKWIQLHRSCSDENNEMSKKGFAKEIISAHRSFIAGFNEYRTELIHRKSSASYANVTWELVSGKTSATFVCSDKLKKEFKKIVDKNDTYTIAYLTYKLIEESLLQTSKVLTSIRNEFASMTEIAENVRTGEAPAIFILDKTTGLPQSHSIGYWKKFDELFSNNE